MTNKICIHEECSTRANFNYKGIKPALYCSKHKLENMVDVNNKIAVKNDFSGSVIYKIYCKDENIKDFYIGSSKDLYDRMRVHKSMCYNENVSGYSLKIYEFIRENSDWGNFNVEIVEYYPCKNEKELKQREQYYIKKYEPTLNCHNAYIAQEEKKERKKEIDRKYKQSEKGKATIKKYEEQRYNNPEKTSQKKEYLKNHRQQPKKCEICNIMTTVGSWCNHIKTKEHIDNLKNKSIITEQEYNEMIQKIEEKKQKQLEWKTKSKYCEICDRTVKNNHWSAHLKTKIHLENIEKKKNGSAEN